MVLADILSRLGWNDEQLRWLYPAQVGTVALLLWVYRDAYAELSLAFARDARMWLVATATGVVVFVVWINLDAEWMAMGTSRGYDPSNGAGMNWSLVAIRLTGAALVVPLMEELFWRSFLLRWLVNGNFLLVTPGQVRLWASVATAVLFAVEHDLWLAGLFAGVAFNVLYIRSGTLWSPLIAHAVANALLGGWVIHSNNWKYW